MWTYERVKALLGSRNLCEAPSTLVRVVSTWFVRGENGDLHLKYHDTNVVTYHPDGTYTLNSGGYRTSTTKRRINLFGPVPLFQKDYVWYLRGGVPFSDGMRVDSKGNPVG